MSRSESLNFLLSHTKGKSVSSLYDYGAGEYLNIAVGVSADRVQGYDYKSGAHFGGTLPSLFHYGESAHIELKHSNGKYRGYDYGAGSHFEITVRGNSVDLFDFGTGHWFSYSA